LVEDRVAARLGGEVFSDSFSLIAFDVPEDANFGAGVG
jgi:hypothetical protein